MVDWWLTYGWIINNKSVATDENFQKWNSKDNCKNVISLLYIIILPIVQVQIIIQTFWQEYRDTVEGVWDPEGGGTQRVWDSEGVARLHLLLCSTPFRLEQGFPSSRTWTSWHTLIWASTIPAWRWGATVTIRPCTATSFFHHCTSTSCLSEAIKEYFVCLQSSVAVTLLCEMMRYSYVCIVWFSYEIWFK